MSRDCEAVDAILAEANEQLRSLGYDGVTIAHMHMGAGLALLEVACCQVHLAEHLQVVQEGLDQVRSRLLSGSH